MPRGLNLRELFLKLPTPGKVQDRLKDLGRTSGELLTATRMRLRQFSVRGERQLLVEFVTPAARHNLQAL